MLNTLIIAIALMSAPKADIAASDALPTPVEQMPPCYKKLKMLKDADPNGWRFDMGEWDAMFHRRPRVPEQYTDPVHGSNNGIDWAEAFYYPWSGNPATKSIKAQKDADPNGWKFSIDEWDDMIHRRPRIPEQYTDPVHGSNGGVDWA